MCAIRVKRREDIITRTNVSACDAIQMRSFSEAQVKAYRRLGRLSGVIWVVTARRQRVHDEPATCYELAVACSSPVAPTISPLVRSCDSGEHSESEPSDGQTIRNTWPTTCTSRIPLDRPFRPGYHRNLLQRDRDPMTAATTWEVVGRSVGAPVIRETRRVFGRLHR